MQSSCYTSYYTTVVHKAHIIAFTWKGQYLAENKSNTGLNAFASPYNVYYYSSIEHCREYCWINYTIAPIHCMLVTELSSNLWTFLHIHL